jgi:hypothetical protein
MLILLHFLVAGATKLLWEAGSFSFTETETVEKLITEVHSFPAGGLEFSPPVPTKKLFLAQAKRSVVVPGGDGPRPGTAIPSMYALCSSFDIALARSTFGYSYNNWGWWPVFTLCCPLQVCVQ